MKAADFVRTCRETLGLTKTQFGLKLGRDRKTIKRWEIGENEPSFGDIEKMKALSASAKGKQKRGA